MTEHATHDRMPTASKGAVDSTQVAVVLAESQDVVTSGAEQAQRTIYDLYTPGRRKQLLFVVAIASIILPHSGKGG